jgi:hypothetical protein
MHTLATVLAFGWQPELRGLSAVGIAVVALCGGVYLLLGTNLGARLGFLVALAGFFGWMFLMGIIWWVYGIGLQGQLPSWGGVETVIGTDELANANNEITVRIAPVIETLEGQTDAEAGVEIDGWKRLPSSDPGLGQAQAAAAEIAVEQGLFTGTEQYLPTAVYAYGGETYPDWFFNLWHRPHYNLVELSPTVPQRAEPGQAPPAAIVDETAPKRYVMMLRDLGYRRRPAAIITVSSGVIFAFSCLALHRRDRRTTLNLSQAVVKVSA